MYSYVRSIPLFLLLLSCISIQSQAQTSQQAVRYGTQTIEGQEIFYREAGDPANPALVLLHGFPSSSHMYRELLTSLSDEYYLIAPDYPGFGNSSFPLVNEFTYTFDNLAKVTNTLLEQKGIHRYSIVMQDYGAPVGFRIATAHPERVQTIITQNGNAYEEGINAEAWAPIVQYWKTPTQALGDTIAENVYSADGMRWQYTHGTRNPDAILPDNWILDYANISRPGQKEIQLALFYDYQTNLALYPEWQAYLREHQPSVLVVWGKNDAFFPEAGAEAFKRDVKDIDYNIYDTGHFALEEEHLAISQKIREFLQAREIL